MRIFLYRAMSVELYVSEYLYLEDILPNPDTAIQYAEQRDAQDDGNLSYIAQLSLSFTKTYVLTKEYVGGVKIP